MVSGLPLLCHEDECLIDVIQNGTNGFVYEDKNDFITKYGFNPTKLDIVKSLVKEKKLIIDEYNIPY